MTREIKTAEDWLAVARYRKDQLRALVDEFHPFYKRAREMPITAAVAELACEGARTAIAATTKEDPLAVFDRVLESGKGLDDLALLFSQTWFGVPESRDAHSLPGFGALCDLCSESWVLEPEGDDDGQEGGG